MLASEGVHLLMLLPVCLLLMCTLVQYQCADGTDIYIHASDFMVPVFCMVVLGQPVCDV